MFKLSRRIGGMLLSIFFLFMEVSPVLAAVNTVDLGQVATADAKGLEIARLKQIDKQEISFDGVDYDIQVTSITQIKGGIQVFARAWEKGKQIGFNHDGTVDLERFLIYNPPVLVPDPKGKIIREWEDGDGNKFSRSLTEDPQKALLQTLAHAIKVKTHKIVGGPVIAGKVGHTTSVFYSDAGKGGNVRVDGYASDGADTTGTWAAVVNGNGTFSDATSSGLYVGRIRLVGNEKGLYRSMFTFDTSPLGAGTATSGTISFYGYRRVNELHATWILTEGDLTNHNDIVNADYQLNKNFTDKWSDATYTDSTWNITGYNDWPLNATGTAGINGYGDTIFGVKSTCDASGGVSGCPTGVGNNAEMDAYSADQTGTTQDPVLIVEHEPTPITVSVYAHSNDGYVSNSYCNEMTNWAAIRNGSTTSNVCDSQKYIKVRSDSADGAYQIYRGSLVFDTSLLPDIATITAATLHVYATSSGGYNTSGIVITSHSRASTSSLSSTDWTISNFGSTSYGSTTSALATSTYTSITLNSSGRVDINKTGSTTLGILTLDDFTNSDPGSTRKEATFVSVNEIGTSTDPYIEITYIE